MDRTNDIPRRTFIKRTGSALLLLIGGLFLWKHKQKHQTVWQIDPDKCTNCGECATLCVLNPSAVKCFHLYASCGYCDFCSGYYQSNYIERNNAAENLRCPVNAIKRNFIEDPYFKYEIDQRLCIGCGKCAEACQAFGNGSLVLQINHNLCVQCNLCNIAEKCPDQAISRINADSPYLLPKEYL